MLTQHGRRRQIRPFVAATTWSLLISLLGAGAPISAQTVPGSPYPAAVLADRPAAYWRLAEASGSLVADSSGNGQTGTITGGVALGAAGALAGDANTAMAFDGTSGYIRATGPLAVGSDFTIEAWVKAASAAAHGPIVSLRAADRQARTLYLDNGRFLGMNDLSAAWPTYTVMSQPVDPTTWHAVVFTVQGTSSLKVYVDGALAGSASVPATGPFGATPYFAWSTAQWLPKLAGTIDEVALYPQALSPERIAAHYVAGRSPAPAPAPAPVCAGTLQTLVDAAAPGATVAVPPCVYRETVTISKPLTLLGQPGAEIRGSDVWTQWAPSGGTWLSQQVVPPLPAWNDPSRCQPNTGNRCLWPEQVFLDGRPLQPLAPGALPGPGQFALLSATDRHVRLGSDPTGHTLEVTVRPKWVLTRSDHVTLQGLTLRHAGNDALTGAVANDGFSDWALQDSTLSDAHGADVSIAYGANLRVLRNDISRAGQMGLHGTDLAQGLVQGNHIHDNHTDGFATGWGAGGLKVTHLQGLVLDGNAVDHNAGPGLWCDVGCQGLTVSNNRVHHQPEAGIFFEISDGASIHDNAVWENGWQAPGWGWGAGILISSSAHAEVFNNTLAWNAAGISVISMNRADQPTVGPVGNYVHDNTVVRKVVTGDFGQTYWSNLSLAWLTDGTGPLYDPASNNRGASNRYWDDLPESLSVRFSWSAQYLHLADFEATPGDSGGRYLTDNEKDQVLSARGIPSAPEIRS